MSSTVLDIHIEQQYDDSVYLYATVNQKPGLIATGEDLEELFIDLADAMSAWDETKLKLERGN